MLQEGSSASVGAGQVAGQEAQEGECRGQPGVQGEWASSCGSPGELILVVTGLFWVSGVKQAVFVPGSRASNFFKRRGNRPPKPQYEINGKDVGGLPSAGPLVPSLSQAAGQQGLQGAMGYM